MTRIYLQRYIGSAMDQRRFAKGRGGGVQFCPYSWIIVFPFGVERSRLHDAQVRFPRSSIGNDANEEMTIQERLSSLGPALQSSL